MGLFLRLVDVCLRDVNVDDEFLAERLGCKRETAANYLSRARREGLLAGRYLPTLPGDGDWLVLGTRKDGLPLDPYTGLGANVAGTDTRLHLLNGHGEWKRGFGDDVPSLHLSPFELRNDGILPMRPLERSGPTLSVRDRMILCTASLVGDRPAREYAEETGIPRSTVSRRMARMREHGVVRHRFFPGPNLRGKKEYPLDMTGSMVSVARTGGAFPNVLPMLGVALNLRLVKETTEFEAVLWETGGDFAAKSAWVTGGILLGTGMARYLPRSMKDVLADRYRRSVVSVLGEETFGEIRRRFAG